MLSAAACQAPTTANSIDGHHSEPVTLPCINEWMASNQDVPLVPEAQEDTAWDWVEIFNPGPDPVDLMGWTLSDDPDKPDRYAFPDVMLAPGVAWLVKASGDETLGSDHANFRLSANGEAVVLTSPEGDRSQVSWDAAPTDYSMARVPDCCEGAQCWQQVYGGTPGAPNLSAPNWGTP